VTQSLLFYDVDLSLHPEGIRVWLSAPFSTFGTSKKSSAHFKKVLNDSQSSG